MARPISGREWTKAVPVALYSHQIEELAAYAAWFGGGVSTVAREAIARGLETLRELHGPPPASARRDARNPRRRGGGLTPPELDTAQRQADERGKRKPGQRRTDG